MGGVVGWDREKGGGAVWRGGGKHSRRKQRTHRLKICALDPSLVQSLTYADAVACSVDHPPSEPSIKGESRRRI